jgi:hypothetical protein
MDEGLQSEHERTHLDWALRVMSVALLCIFGSLFFIPEGQLEGWGDLMMMAYSLLLSPVSAILVFLDRKSRATSMLWVPAVLIFCALALPVYMFARRRREN